MTMIRKLIEMLNSAIFAGFAMLVARVALAGVFWRSGRTKVEEGSLLTIRENTFYQFNSEPFNNVPVINGDLGAYVTTYAEHILPILLVLGLFTRFAALALLVMTLVIQIFVFPAWPVWWATHILWAGLALVIMAHGAGIFSLDHWIGRYLFRW